MTDLGDDCDAAHDEFRLMGSLMDFEFVRHGLFRPSCRFLDTSYLLMHLRRNETLTFLSVFILFSTEQS